MAPRLPFLPPRGQSPPSRGLAEGCFCPDGSVLFSSNADVCVPQCRKRPTSPDQPAGGRGRPWGGNPWLEPLQPGLRTLGPGCTHLWTPAPTQSGVVRPRTLLGPLTLQQLEIWAKEEAPAGGGEARPAGSPETLSPSLPACVGPDGFPKFVSLEKQGGASPNGGPALPQPLGGWYGVPRCQLHPGHVGCSRDGSCRGQLRCDLLRLVAQGWGAAQELLGTLPWFIPAWRAVGQQLPDLCVQQGLHVGALHPCAVPGPGPTPRVQPGWLCDGDQASG